MNWITWAKRAWPLFAQILPYLLPVIPILYLHYKQGQELKGCQAERTTLTAIAKKAAEDQVRAEHAKDLAKKDLIISEKDAEIFRLREKNALDSARNLSILESIRAINERYQKR
ncbi:hypothetical protein [Siphonobacter sp. SORGH_AS_1065]|uniref:hypothetical protein n=1 Tax=Siphonobacter sp. SORGH_AS_1065 TaxID=3041795 RepID=UPI0027846237|nr:hypothetical protein [Siphonobacter sp. SORGH_AS_1065]MDQ1088988.1 hypothetical protein [Siphonobacter sp. SORGH_AS_1065]